MMMLGIKELLLNWFFNKPLGTINLFQAEKNILDTYVDGLDVQLDEYNITQYELEKMNHLKNIGLVNSVDVLETQHNVKKFNDIKQFSNTHKYFDKNYPNNEFLLVNQLNKICKEGNYFCTSLKYYTKEIPDNNYNDLKNFSLREEDKTYFGIYRNITGDVNRELEVDIVKYYENFLNDNRFEFSSKEVYKEFKKNALPFNKKDYHDSFPMLICTQIQNLDANFLKINSDIKFKKYNPKYGYTAILQPVYKENKFGFLIVTLIEDKNQT